MKIKILQYVPRLEIGTMVDLQPGEIVAMDDEVAKKLIDAGKADYEI